MKKLFYFFGLFLLIITTSCSDDDNGVIVNLDYPFDVRLNYDNSAMQGEDILIKAVIENLFDYEVPADLKFSMISHTQGGKILLNDEIYYSGSDIPLKLGTNTFRYVPDNSGAQSLNLTFSNNKGEEIDKVININVRESRFNFSVNQSNEGYYQDVETQISMLINNLDSPNDTEYEFKYSILNGGATIKTIEGNTLTSNNYMPIEHSVPFYLKVTPSQTGILRILFTVKNEYGVVLDQQVEWNIINAYFDFTANVQSPDIIATVNFPTAINIQGSHALNYEMEFGESNQNGEFLPGAQISGYTFMSGQTSGTVNYDFSSELIAEQSTTRYLAFKITNNANVTKTIVKSITVVNPNIRITHFNVNHNVFEFSLSQPLIYASYFKTGLLNNLINDTDVQLDKLYVYKEGGVLVQTIDLPTSMFGRYFQNLSFMGGVMTGFNEAQKVGVQVRDIDGRYSNILYKDIGW